MTNIDRILKNRDITLPTKVHIFKAMVFPVVIYGYESWTIKKAEHQTINAFELWCWSRLLGLLDCKEIKPVSHTGNWPWVFTGRTDAESETPIILHLMQRAVSLKNDQDYADKIKAEVEGDDTGQNSWVVSLTQWTWVLGNSKIVKDREA